MRQTRFPFTAAERHDSPVRVRAWQRGASDIFASPAAHGGVGLLSKISGSPGNVDVLMLMDMSFMLHRDLLSGGAALALHLPHRVHLHGEGTG
jgi:hypothetical protein